MAEPYRRTLPVIPPALRDDGLPTGVFSSTQHGMYKKCGRMYEFRYVEGKVRPPGVSRTRGIAVHAGTEVAHRYMIERRAVPPADLVIQATVDRFEAGRAEVTDWEDTTPGRVKDEAVRLAHHYHARALPALRPVAAEKGFVARVGTVPVMGFIDLLDHPAEAAAGGVEDPGRLEVVDTKTAAAKWSQHEVDRSPQLTLYAIVEGAYHVRVDNLVPLKAGPAYHRLPSTRDAHAKAVLVEDLEETVDLVKRGVFPRTAIDHWACSPKWCGYWGECRGRRT